MDAAQEQTIVWNVQTHEHFERSTDWYWGWGLAAVVGAAASIIVGNLLLAFILIIGIGSLGLLVARGPREHSVRLDSRGVSLDGTLYRYPSVRSFWVERESPDGSGPRLLVSTSGVLSPQLIIPLLDDRRAQNVRAFLKRFAAEEEQAAHLGDTVAQIFGL